MALVNMTELIVRERLTQLLSETKYCKCEKCYTDMLAIVLNYLKPQYVNTRKGELLKRASVVNLQNQIDVDIAITKAIERVAKVPHHSDDRKDD